MKPFSQRGVRRAVMHSTIESALAAAYADDRIRQAAVARQARAARRSASPDRRPRRWFIRSGSITASRPVHSDR
jgi:hypothetical protein